MTIHSLLTSDLGTSLPLHISLSRPINLLTAQKESFLRLLQSSVGRSAVRPWVLRSLSLGTMILTSMCRFDLSPASLDWVSNEEGTRWFLVVRLSPPEHDELNRLLGLCNTTVEVFGESPLYSTSHQRRPARAGRTKAQRLTRRPSHRSSALTGAHGVDSCFHISIAWSLQAPTEAVKEHLHSPEIQSILHRLKNTTISFSSVKVKLGNVVHDLKLEAGIGDDDAGVFNERRP